MTTTSFPTLTQTLWPVSSSRPWIRNLIIVFAGSLLLTLSAKIQIPFFPVPLTMQTLVVLLLGFGLGWRLGMATILLYLAEGAMGLPVFAGTPEKGIGPAYMFGPTGGYLLGFVLAAGLCGWLAQRGWDRRPATIAAAMITGNGLIYCTGLLWLGAVIGWDKPLLQLGVLPFIPGDLLKIGIAMLALPMLWKYARRSD